MRVVRIAGPALAAMMLALPPGIAAAQDGRGHGSGHSGQVMPGMEAGPRATPGNPSAPAAPDTPATTAYRQAMERMHMRMDIPYTGDADKDFAAGMIPHHQGAIDMARIELQYGKDPELKKLARNVVTAQEKEIAFLKRWQVRHGEKRAE